MYLQIINRYIDLSNPHYIIYYRTSTALEIFLLKNYDMFEVCDSGNITIFLKLPVNNKDQIQWVTSTSISYFDDMNIYQTNKIYLKRYDTTDKKSLIVMPTNIFNILQNKCAKTYVYHMKYQVLFEEYISANVYKMLDIMYRRITSKCFHEIIINSFIKYFSKLLGYYYDSVDSKKRIYSFIQEYNIDMSIIPFDEKIKWKCFNDFFSRNIDLKHRPLELINRSNSIVCPADSRVISFSSNEYMKNYIKNPKFIFNKIINYIGDKQECLLKGSGIICRLAPQDYHHFHSPIDGCIHSMNILGIDLNSVNPIAMQSKHINILNDNMRIILNIKNKFGLECYYVIIGASLVGSVRFHSYKLNRIYQYLIDNKTNSHIITQPISVTIGEDLGTFLYGGSTVVMIFNKVIDFRTEIKQYSLYDNSNKSIDPIESYCHVRSYLGSFDENISNK